MKTHFTYLLFFVCLLLSCKKDHKTNIVEAPKSIEIKPEYAKGFSIHKSDSFTKISIFNPLSNVEDSLHYYLIPKKNKIPNYLQNEKVIRTPVEKIIVCSTTDIPILEALEKENSLVGFPEVKYISSPKTRKRIDHGKVTDIGSLLQPNIEKILSIHPEVMVSSTSENQNKGLLTLEKAGIVNITNGSWLENHPLGRAEWIKVYGYLFNKEEKATSYFNNIVSNYNKALLLGQKSNTAPTVLAGNLYKDVWYAPGGKSYVAQLINDANGSYFWKNDSNTGSLPLSFETVFNTSQNADIWIGGGQFSNRNQLITNNNKYRFFKAVENNSVYSKDLKKGATGGTLYYEEGSLRPDFILKDLIKIFHPNLATDYKFHFYQKLD